MFVNRLNFKRTFLLHAICCYIVSSRNWIIYRILHSYKLFWAVCHLFPQRWRTLNIKSRETIGQEDHVTCLKLRRRVNSSPAFGATYKTRIFYIYVFKHSCSLLPNFFAAATHSLQRESTGEKSNTMNGPRRHSYTMTMRRFPVSVKLPVSNHKKGHFKHVILL